MQLRISSSVFLFALTSTAFASHSPAATSVAKFYLGAFGGGGSSNHFKASQFGTAFFPEAMGGPLSINAFGQLNSKKTAFLGFQLGYQAQEIPLNASSQWALGVAAELEGYFMNKRSFSGTLVNNNTVRLPEHDFMVSYPMKKSVFLVNAVLSFKKANLPIHPYIGFGIGNAITKISDAYAMQINPPEADVNHYNTSISDTKSTFAGQLKLGLNYDINKYLSLFGEYRWLYLASTDFLFGSTLFLNHVETSSWQVKLDAQKYNLGSVGIRFKW
ncbi:outer membrane beta-barrel protein [Candidatus Berkiella cookevillensis]|uniref:Outer membrane beta-barrel protein n=1 Tax=Candidatus Berkiella cookevillensis TaxID=437022 RepID=A0A0Q9YD83_9GAMM|nr:outer membrane beta-barrel protein [Candidatus Berkiella cookevillensis]MCS5707914.1 outer membrane beta-barrel protein [Candidatus Berkiella cookevillensis]